jgi:hypothetical protein
MLHHIGIQELQRIANGVPALPSPHKVAQEVHAIKKLLVLCVDLLDAYHQFLVHSDLLII